jgi:hypothetical protein
MTRPWQVAMESNSVAPPIVESTTQSMSFLTRETSSPLWSLGEAESRENSLPALDNSTDGQQATPIHDDTLNSELVKGSLPSRRIDDCRQTGTPICRSQHAQQAVKWAKVSLQDRKEEGFAIGVKYLTASRISFDQPEKVL